MKEKALSDKHFCEIYDFHRLVKAQKHAERHEGSDIQKDKRFLKKLRSPLEVGKKVLPLAERLKNKMCLVPHIKARQKICHFLNVSKFL